MPPKARVEKRLYYKIGEACKVLDIQPYVLRYWETEFPALSPSKSRSGQRVYSEKELGVIRRIKQLLYDEGYTIAGAKKRLETELADGTLPSAEEEAEAEAAPARAPARRPARPPAEKAQPAPPAPAGTAEPVQQGLLLDTRTVKQVESLRQGIERALREARDILALLDSKSPNS